MWVILFICISILLLYIFLMKRLTYWNDRGVPGPSPLPLVGNIGPSIIGLKIVSEIYADIYRKYKDCPFVGLYRMGTPCLLIRDPEIIKNVLIKDFNHFMENDLFVDKNIDPLVSLHAFSLNGEEWKKSRQFTTPNFATGKIKATFPLAENASKHLVTYLKNQEDKVLNSKDFFTKYNCDVVALFAFGIEGNSFDDSNAQILTLARKFITPDSLQGVKIAISILIPKLITNIKFLPQAFEDGIVALTSETLRYREENNIRRNDFFDAISHTPSISLFEIAAHLGNFMIDGFESASTVMTLVLYELTKNLECQIKLRNEINTVLQKYDGELSYEAMQEMIYLDACVNVWHTISQSNYFLVIKSSSTDGSTGQKTCSQEYNMTSSDPNFKNLSVNVEKGTSIIIPLLGLHHDPKYFPSPEKYMPERFLNKSDSFKNIYMPFGNGPRMCLGSRFGLMQVKIGIAQVIKNFEVIMDKKTRQPLKYDPLYFALYPKGGLWVKCKKIVNIQ